MNKRLDTKYIIVHCSYTPAEMDIGVKEIREWHTRDNGWSDIGYHYVIRRSHPHLEEGRKEDLIGAHCAGRNHDSIGICLVGGKSGSSHIYNFTEDQMWYLRELINAIQTDYDNRLIVAGHHEFSAKACPTFNARIWYEEDILVYV